MRPPAAPASSADAAPSTRNGARTLPRFASTAAPRGARVNAFGQPGAIDMLAALIRKELLALLRDVHGLAVPLPTDVRAVSRRPAGESLVARIRSRRRLPRRSRRASMSRPRVRRLVVPEVWTR